MSTTSLLHACESAISMIHVSVRSAFGANSVSLSADLPASQVVGEVKDLVEKATGVPRICQTLLLEGGVIPLQDPQQLVDLGIASDVVLLLIQQLPRHPLRELWRLCFGCLSHYNRTYVLFENDYNAMMCHCNGATRACGTESFQSISENTVRYLVRVATPEDARMQPTRDQNRLQRVFNFTVMTGQLPVVRALADHPNIAVCGTDAAFSACRCCVFKPLIERAAELLIAIGRLKATDVANWFTADRDPLCDWEPAQLPLCDIILLEGWSMNSFCAQYLAIVSRAKASCRTVQVIRDQSHYLSSYFDAGECDERDKQKRRDWLEHRKIERRFVADCFGENFANTQGRARHRRLEQKDNELNTRRARRKRHATKCC